MSTTTASGRRWRISRSSACPSRPAMRTSEMTTSTSRRSSTASAAAPSAAVSTWWPRPRTQVARCSRMFFSSSTMRMLATSAPRQLEREAAPFADLALEPDPPAVGLHDVAHDGEPEPRGAGFGPVRALDEALEDALALLGGDARARVAHRDQHPAVLGARLEHDAPAARRVAERIGDEVRERPGDLRRVPGDREAARRPRRRKR